MVLLEEAGLRVEVVVNDVVAKEFPSPAQPDVADGDLEVYPFMRERYIESEAGVGFSISFAVLDTHGLLKTWVEADEDHAIALRVSIDGQSVHQGFFRRLGQDRKVRGVIDHTNNMVQKFQFAAIIPSRSLVQVSKVQQVDCRLIFCFFSRGCNRGTRDGSQRAGNRPWHHSSPHTQGRADQVCPPHPSGLRTCTRR